MSTNHNSPQTETFRHIRKDPVTGEKNYFYPLEITDPSIRALALERGLEIGKSRLGNRVFEAAMIPCKDTAIIHGVEVFVDTPSDVQRKRYLEYIKDELAEQDARKQDGRCQVSDGHGGLKRCPCRVPNPDYVPGSNQLKTLPVKCEGCQYEKFKQAHTTIVLSTMDHEDETGDFESYEIPASKDILSADRYLALKEEFVAFVRARNPKLAKQAELKTLEFTNSEIARLLDQPKSTVTSRAEKLQALAEAFIDTIIIH